MADEKNQDDVEGNSLKAHAPQVEATEAEDVEGNRIKLIRDEA